MRTSEIEVGTVYELKDGTKFIPVEKSSWKTGSWNGAHEDVDWRFGGQNIKVWRPEFNVHSSQIVGDHEVLEAERRAKAADAEARAIARRHQERLEEAERMDRWGSLVELTQRVFPELRVQVDDRYDWGTSSKVPELRIGWLDYSVAAQWFLKVSRELGSVCTELPRSTAMAEPLAAVAIGLTPEPTGHTTDMVFKGEAELEALQAVLAAEIVR